MITFLIVIHIVICILLVISILLQSSKGGGLAGMFGGGGMGGVFGGRGAASFLAKVAMWLGVGFALTSITIAILSSRMSTRQRGAVENVMQREQSSSPAAILPTIPGEGGETEQPAGGETQENQDGGK